ncbi:hypothetical protein BDB00DRAFT_789231 [Zychaea mexicana]|uniref:uncharacterized protein n=1 Tax=Zychaea mexicana TaxID=64656 RepID=UPI0022FEDFD1|nr:uncharacterized protein BDB00DRAFT_789231 [Zychaea mexicana]KAI9491919.1 hypothetical protein BDB00DRAFT_789231 [Zychaea mexicana]
MHLYVKHATLINNCYPEKEGESGPRSSELSYLTFYASSRPVKLTKVGIFLENKVKRDVSKSRKQNNQVSLEVIKALIQSCHRDLNLFSKYVVKILSMILSTQDLDLMDLSCDTFIVFCSYHDGSTLGVDAEFTSDFEGLVQRFADLCNNNNSDPSISLSMQHIGHRAIQATISSQALHASNFKVQLSLIMPPLVITLSTTSTSANVLAKKESIDIRQSSLNNSTLDKGVIDILAAKSASILFSQLNGAAVRTALNPLFAYMDNKQKWWPPNFAVSIMELILDALQPQNRYLLVSEVLQQLDVLAKDNSVSEKVASLVSILDTILNANIPLVGISVLEVLNSLFTHLIKALQGRSFRDENPTDAADIAGMYEYAVHQGLAHSIGGLASQTYYQNQLNDVTGYIIAKLRAGTALEQVEGLPIHEYRRVALICLDLIVSTSKDAGADDEYASESTISLSSWLPAISLLTDRIPETRVEFAQTLTRYLEVTTNEAELTPEPYPKHLLNQHGDVMFVNAVHQTIIDWVQMPSCNVGDVGAMYTLLCALTRRFGADGSIRTVPLVFKLQSLVKQSAIKQTSRQRAVAAATIEWFGMVAHMHQISPLQDYLKGLKDDRVAHKEYSPIFLPEIAPTVAHVNNFEEIEPENTTVVDKFIDRHAVVEILSKDGPLRDEDDTHGLDLESKLYVEWGSEAFVNQERSFRIRSSRDLDDVKPKLVTPWFGADFDSSERGQKNTIKVENLKEALVSQQKSTGASENELDSLQMMTKRSLAKRPTETKTDIDSILSSLSLGINTTQPSSTSLVNPPYKG